MKWYSCWWITPRECGWEWWHVSFTIAIATCSTPMRKAVSGRFTRVWNGICGRRAARSIPRSSDWNGGHTAWERTSFSSWNWHSTIGMRKALTWKKCRKSHALPRIQKPTCSTCLHERKMLKDENFLGWKGKKARVCENTCYKTYEKLINSTKCSLPLQHPKNNLFTLKKINTYWEQKRCSWEYLFFVFYMIWLKVRFKNSVLISTTRKFDWL